MGCQKNLNKTDSIMLTNVEQSLEIISFCAAIKFMLELFEEFELESNESILDAMF